VPMVKRGEVVGFLGKEWWWGVACFVQALTADFSKTFAINFRPVSRF
jgi:hypothetical protein